MRLMRRFTRARSCGTGLYSPAFAALRRGSPRPVTRSRVTGLGRGVTIPRASAHAGIERAFSKRERAVSDFVTGQGGERKAFARPSRRSAHGTDNTLPQEF